MLAVAPAGAAAAQDPAVPPVPDVAARTTASVGKVFSAGGTGSGWVAGRGSVVTNHHVARGGSGDIFVRYSDGELVECYTAAGIRELDVAVLRCPTGRREPLPLRRDVAPAGTAVTVVGYPRGVGPTVTTGEVTGERRRVGDIRTIGFTAAIQPGSSGSPVVGPDGHVVGVATFGGGYGVPSTDVEPLVERAAGLPATKAGAEWRLRLRRVALVAPLVLGLAFFLRRRYGKDRPLRGAVWWAVGASVLVLALTQGQFMLVGPTSYF